MARPRTGNLVPKPSGFFARVWVKLPDGTEERRFINLQTKDRSSARRKLARVVAMIASGEAVADAEAKAVAPETYKAFTADRNAKRGAAGVVMARDEQRNRAAYIYPIIGDKPLARVTDDHVREVLEGAAEAGLARGTVDKIRGVLLRDFERARIEKMIATNPVADVPLPDGLKTDERPFMGYTDDQIARYLGASSAFWDPSLKLDLETKMVVLTSRTQGGMRTAEVIRWDWQMIDLVDFALCWIPRAKGGKPQQLQVPEVLRPFLRGWWVRAGSPLAGPVFPVRRGPRAGKDKKSRGTSFASRMRRDFFRAGVVSQPPVVDPKTKVPAPNPADPLYFDTPVTRRPNTHSMRRTYDRALAAANVNVQTSMALSGHADPKVHMRYARDVDAAAAVPLAALPTIDPGLAARILAPPVPKRPGNDIEKLAEVLVFPERDTSLELATFGLGSRRSTN